MTKFEEYCARKRAEYGDKFVPPSGREFIDAFNKGERYRVQVRTLWDGHSHTRWGFIGVTTGWQPCFLLMRNVLQRGSSDTLTPGRDQVIDWHWL
jgi:hypothetical protein